MSAKTKRRTGGAPGAVEVRETARARDAVRTARAAAAGLTALALLAGCEGFGMAGFEADSAEPDYTNLDPQLADLPPASPMGEPPLPPRRPAPPANLRLDGAMAAPVESAEPAVEVGTLVGMGFAETETLLGLPSQEQVQPPAKIWSYEGPDCVLTIFFYPQVGGEQYRALAYDVGETAADAQSAQRCFTALIARNRAPDAAPKAEDETPEAAKPAAPATKSGVSGTGRRSLRVAARGR